MVINRDENRSQVIESFKFILDPKIVKCIRKKTITQKRSLHDPKIDSDRGIQISDSNDILLHIFVKNSCCVPAKEPQSSNIDHCKIA